MEPDEDVKLKKIKSKFISTSGPVPPKPTPNVRQNVGGEPEEVPARKPTKPKSKSIFAQRMAQKAESKKGGPSAGRLGGLGGSGDMSQEDKMAMEIQTLMQNIGVISANERVTSGDIISMRENIMKSMNKSSLEFLRGRGAKKEPQRKKTEEKGEPGSGAKIPKTEEEKPRMEEDLKKVRDKLPIQLEEVKGVPHMETVEIPKLEWTLSTDGSSGKEEGSKNVPGDIQARFDLNGNLLDPKSASDTTWLQGLHHHGEEMDKPGYTFEELLIYARSTTVSQRGFALNALAGIFKNSHEGVYDSALSINPLNLLTNVDVISVIRKSLDFEDMVTLDASFACLAAVMFPDTEEECYDVVYLFPNAKPFLWHKVVNVDRDVVKDPTTRDHQILTMDLISFLIERSHLLDRIEYLLVDRLERVSQAVELNLLKILIRVARHSPDVLVRYDRILSRVYNNITTGNWSAISAASAARPSGKDADVVTNNPLAISVWLSLKLFRVIVESSLENCHNVHSRYNLMPSVLTYLATDYRYGLQSSSHAKLVILESFRFWCSSLDLGYGVSEFSTIFPVLALNLRHFCDADSLQNIAGFDGYYLAYVFHFLRCIISCGERGFEGIHTSANAWSMVKDMEFFVLTITMNVLQILTTKREDWALAMAGKGVEFLTAALKLGQLEHRKSAIVEHVKHLDFSDIANSLQQHSIILNMSKIRSRYPSNYVSSSAILTSAAVNYIIAKKSPFQFYKPWLLFMKELGCANVILTPQIWKYVELLAESYPLEFFETHYIRFELLFIYSLFSIMDVANVPLSILVHLICTLSKSDMVLFNGLLKLTVQKVESENETCKDDIVKLYMSCFYPGISLDNSVPSDGSLDFCPDLSLPKGRILFQPLGVSLVNGKFWMFEPLKKLSGRYSKSPTDLKTFLPLVVQETRSCLYFVQFLLSESIFTSASDLISCYIHITQTFTMGEDVFLDPSIEFLLGNILKIIVTLLENTYGKDPKPFTNYKPGPGLEHISSFKDIYGELVKEFESVSYCSNIFSAYLLLPLIPTESREMKLLFWSMQGLQFVRLELNNALIPPDYLTREVETDRALLQLYTILLVKTSTINRSNNELLFHVLDYHVTRGLPVEDMQKVMKLM